MKTIKKPKLIISPLVKTKADKLIKYSDKEIAWHGFIERIDDIFYWYDIILYPQYNTAATSTSEDEEYANWLIRQMEFNNFEDMRLHGHSHVNMSCNPSGTDDQFRKNITTNLKDNDFYIFIIMNKRGEYTLEVFDKSCNTIYEEKDIEIIIGRPDDLKDAEAWAIKAIKNNVKERNFQRCSTTSNPQNSSTLTNYTEKYTLQDAVQWEDPLQRYLQGLV